MDIWSLILLDPILNFLIALSKGLFNNFGLAIITLTLIVRFVMFPLTMKQLRGSREMSEKMKELQPKLQQIQKKYARDRQRLQQEIAKLYKEAGVNPMGCLTSPILLSMLIQMPIWIALYQSVIHALARTPQDLLGLSQHLYSWSVVREALPISGQFLWLDLAYPDRYFAIPLLVMATMWVSQKMVTTPATDPKQQSMNSMMQLMMPLMFGLICFSLPSGLGLYWVISGIFSIVLQYFVYGWGYLRTPKQVPEKKVVEPRRRRAEVMASKQLADKHKADIVINPGQTSEQEGSKGHGRPRDKR